MRIILTDITNQFILPLWNKKALEVVDHFVSPSADIQTTFLSGQGPQALKKYVKKILNAFSDFEFSIQEVLTFDNQQIYKWQGNAIPSNAGLSIESKNEKVIFSGIISVEMHEGIIISYHSFSDIPRIVSTTDNTIPITEQDPNLFSFNKEDIIAALKQTTGRRLTNREVECLSLWLKGFSIKDTAKLLGDLSARTVQTFRENIKRKLNVDTYQQLFSLIQSSGLMALLLN